MEMDESGLCPECGAHDYVSSQHLWLNNGDIVMKTGQTERLVFFESENLDPLMSGIEEVTGVSTKTGFYTMEMVSDADDFRSQLALRGMGNLKDLKVDKKGLRMRLDNATLHLMIVGMMQGIFD